MQLVYHFPETALEDYEIVYLPGPNNPLSLYKKYKESDSLSINKKSTIKSIALQTLKHLNLSEKYLDNIISEFIELYSSIFTDPDEKEDTEGMIRRVKGLEKVTGQTILVICVRKKDKEVVGGFILELHYRSVCLLLTYIFTKQSERGQGLGYSFIQTVLPYVVSNLIGVRLKAVFLETENPSFTPDYTEKEVARNSFPPNNIHSKRLTFFRKAGAKWLNILYAQPRLSIEPKDFGNRVYHLFFLMLPDAVKNKELLADKKTIFNFLFKFYNTLEYSDRTKLTKKSFVLILANAQRINKVKDIDLYRSYLQIELLSTLYQFKADNTLKYQADGIIKLLESIKNQFSFVAIEVKKIKEYTYGPESKGYTGVFIKELTQLLIEKVTGRDENPRSVNPIINVEYENYVTANLKYPNYSYLYISQGTREADDVTVSKDLSQLMDREDFQSLNDIEKSLIKIREKYLVNINAHSIYDAFISELPSI